ncbi:hypothetical protein NC651_021514 [Populus alba x Populus x berolinensis]|nr:hypothetical protein NC651_021514 [Populus alba x Populus x berolinensis]
MEKKEETNNNKEERNNEGEEEDRVPQMALNHISRLSRDVKESIDFYSKAKDEDSLPKTDRGLDPMDNHISFQLDFQSGDRDLPVVGECQSSERFNRLAWGRNGSGSDAYGLGLIAGGLVDGNIDIWKSFVPAKNCLDQSCFLRVGNIGKDGNLFEFSVKLEMYKSRGLVFNMGNELLFYILYFVPSSEPSESALVSHLSRHKGPVRGLEFNSINPNLLASGADDGEICIWDVAAPAEPSHFPPLKTAPADAYFLLSLSLQVIEETHCNPMILLQCGLSMCNIGVMQSYRNEQGLGTGSAAQGEISYVSWNCRVQHILASTSSNGITVVWDLKKQKPAISFGDSIRRRCSVLQWHPDVANQLVVASDEDSSPSLRLWDMRNILEPVKEFVGHTKAHICLPVLKIIRTICWNTVTGEIACELPAGTNWNFDVHWYPKMPGVISASSFDGKIGIYNIEGCSRYIAGESDFGREKLRAPKWYKRPVGASFGFGGKLVSFHPRSSAGWCFRVTEDSLVSRSSEFESAIQNGEKPLLKALCDKKSQESEYASISEDDRETWAFLKVMFEEDGTARTRMLSHLGFSVPAEEKMLYWRTISPGK